jgi:hypothetical protein
VPKNFNSAFNVPVARPRTPVSEDQLLEFVAGRGPEAVESLGTQAPEHSRTQAPERRAKIKPSRKKTILRASGRELRRLGIYFPADLARELAVHCAGEGVELSAFVVAAVRRELARKG